MARLLLAPNVRAVLWVALFTVQRLTGGSAIRGANREAEEQEEGRRGYDFFSSANPQSLSELSNFGACFLATAPPEPSTLAQGE